MLTRSVVLNISASDQPHTGFFEVYSMQTLRSVLGTYEETSYCATDVRVYVKEIW